MTHKIVISQGIHSFDQSVYYEAYCRRCHDAVEGRDRQRNRVWSTKALAMKHAQAHAEWHRELDELNWSGYTVNKKIVGEVEV